MVDLLGLAHFKQTEFLIFIPSAAPPLDSLCWPDGRAASRPRGLRPKAAALPPREGSKQIAAPAWIQHVLQHAHSRVLLVANPVLPTDLAE